MTDIAFSIDHDLADEIGKRASEAGQTSSAWIATSLPRWLEGDALAKLEEARTSLRQTLAGAISQ